MNTSKTVFETLVTKLRERASTPDGIAQPAAILWTDPTRQWAPAVELLRQQIPEFIELGTYSADLRRGPATWVRCVVDRTIEVQGIPRDAVAIIYMPGVSRQELRAGEDCADALRPLVELAYRGVVWHQINGRDWTVNAFLTSRSSLELDVAEDGATGAALLNAVREVLTVPLHHLQGRRLEADDFDGLLSPDLIRDLLRWISSPDATRASLGPEGWSAFVNQLRTQYRFDPDGEGPITAAEHLCGGKSPWDKVWTRFEEAPTAYPGILDTLAKARPGGSIFDDPMRWLQLNDRAEDDLRGVLADLEGVPHAEACQTIVELDGMHGKRRKSVWAVLGRARAACALEPLTRMARAALKTLGGSRPADFVAVYEETGWLADAAVWETMVLADGPEDRDIVEALNFVVEPWLDESARSFQAAMSRQPQADSSRTSPVEVPPGGCLLFVDGLRYDVGRRLAQGLEARGLRVKVGHRWAALPTVTATAKPAATPATGAIRGDLHAVDFAPVFSATGRPVQAPALRDAIRSCGYQVVDSHEMRFPVGPESRGWMEFGAIDRIGHQSGAMLAAQLPKEIERIAQEIASLLDAGWRSVRVVTDHGWLLLPGGLPRVGLPRHLTATGWSRCAIPEGSLPENVVGVNWHWNPVVTVATAPGITCFNSKTDYSHGGLSLQECLVPDLVVERSKEAAKRVTIRSITWLNMRCFVECAGATEGVRADLRRDSPTGQSAGTQIKPLDAEGTVNFVVSDDFEDSGLVLVLLDAQGALLAQRRTRVGDTQ